jgi:hypothetical protein
MPESRLARACALVSRAMGRDPAALCAVTAGQVASALGQAAAGGAREPLGTTRIEHVHPSWFSTPLSRLHPGARAPLLGLLPGPLARFAALALEKKTGQVVQDAPAGRGLTAARLAASLVPPPGHDAPPWLDAAGARDPLAWVSRCAAALPCTHVYSRWSVLARSLEPSFEHAGAPADALVTLAACLAARGDDARALAVRMPFDAGSALLAARARWVLALEPDDAAHLHAHLVDTRGEGPS